MKSVPLAQACPLAGGGVRFSRNAMQVLGIKHNVPRAPFRFRNHGVKVRSSERMDGLAKHISMTVSSLHLTI